MGPNDIIITGDKAKEAFKQLQRSTSLKLSMDDKDKVTARGTAKTNADKKLQQAIDDKNVTVNVNTYIIKLYSRWKMVCWWCFWWKRNFFLYNVSRESTLRIQPPFVGVPSKSEGRSPEQRHQ